jgi:hypothetical protein
MRVMPEVAVAPRPDNEPLYVRSYVFTRFAIGLLGFLLPLALVLLEPAIFDGLPAPRGSLSAYYYSGLREIFVGGLWAIGVFLVVYKFLDFSWESLLSSLAGVAAVLVAVFPTELPGDGVTPNPFQVKFGESVVTGIHYGAAVAFIALLVPITLLFARDEGRRPHRSGRRSAGFWRGFHTISAAFILFGAGLAAFAGITGGPDKGVLYGEWIAIWAFSASWLMKGAEFDVLFRRVPRAAPGVSQPVADDPPESPVLPEG